MRHADLDNLIDAHLDGTADGEQLSELLEHVEADPQARRRLAERSLLEVQLKAWGTQAETVVPRRGRRWRWAVTASLAAAAALVPAVVGWFLMAQSRPAAQVLEGAVAVNGSPVSTLSSGQEARVVGDVPAVLQGHEGSTLTLTPATVAAVEASDRWEFRVRLVSGQGTFAVAKGGGTFRVETPAGSVTALGTQFTVKYDPRRPQAMAVGVREGSVRVDHAGRQYSLSAAQAYVFQGREARLLEGRTLRGRLVRVGQGGREIWVQRGDDPSPTRAILDEACEVTVDGSLGSVDALKPEMVVLLRYALEGDSVVQVIVTGPVVMGRLVMALSGHIVIERGNETRQQLSYDMTPAAIVRIDGQDGSLDELRPQQPVRLHLSADGKTVVQIEQGRGGTEGRGRPR